MKDDKIQTGLRIPSSRYNELKELADQSGVSINSVILFLVDVGLRAINSGIEAECRTSSRTQKRKI